MALDEALAAGEPAPEFAGGIGYNATLEPHPDCPECFGRGVESVIVTDTRKLTGKAAKLYAGAQQTKDGVKALGARPERRSDGPGTLSGHVPGAAGSERTWRRPRSAAGDDRCRSKR
jgi:hypothetical protein